jgi:hypothetical protein
LAQGGQRRFSYFNIKRDNSVFRTAIETAKGSLSLFHDARINRESRHGIHPAASKLIDQPEATQSPPSHSINLPALDARH